MKRSVSLMLISLIFLNTASSYAQDITAVNASDWPVFDIMSRLGIKKEYPNKTVVIFDTVLRKDGKNYVNIDFYDKCLFLECKDDDAVLVSRLMYKGEEYIAIDFKMKIIFNPDIFPPVHEYEYQGWYIKKNLLKESHVIKRNSLKERKKPSAFKNVIKLVANFSYQPLTGCEIDDTITLWGKLDKSDYYKKRDKMLVKDSDWPINIPLECAELVGVFP